METKTATSVVPAQQETTKTNALAETSIFGGSEESFVLAQRQIKALKASQIFPASLKTDGDIMIVLDMSKRLKASPLMVAQNLYTVHGKPAWSSTFLIACINQCGRFSPLRYKMTGEKGKDTYGCVAWAKDLNDGETLESPEITIGMATAEGWTTKAGSKWKNMPELMLRYRCATLFARLYAPELTMGLPMSEEVEDTYKKPFDFAQQADESQQETTSPIEAETVEDSDEQPLLEM